MFTFKPFHSGFFVLSLLTMHLLTACGTSKTEIKDYTSISCSGNESVKLNRNVVSLASSYFMFNRASMQPDFVQVDLNGKYATGKTQVLSDIFNHSIVERLRYDDLDSYNVKLVSLLEMTESVDKNQTLKFSRPCQVATALLDNEQLRSEPSQGGFYLLAGKKRFIIVRDSFNGPEPITPLKFKLLNPDTNQIEEVTFHLHDIVGGDFVPPPLTLAEQIQNLVRREEIANNKKWSINKYTQTIDGRDYLYFTVTKESKGAPIVGEIQSIEFVLTRKS